MVYSLLMYPIYHIEKFIKECFTDRKNLIIVLVVIIIFMLAYELFET